METVAMLPLRDQIAASLREEIFKGHIPEGAELTQELLADSLGVSRIPVREALQILENEGFVQRLPNRHMRVARLTAELVRQDLLALAALETELALQSGLSAEKMPAVAEDDAFHMAFVRSLDNHVLYKTYTTLRELLFGAGIRMELSATEALNAAILDALKAEEKDLVRSTIYSYYETLAELAAKELAL